MTARPTVTARREACPFRAWWWLQAGDGRMVATGFSSQLAAEAWAAGCGYPVDFDAVAA